MSKSPIPKVKQKEIALERIRELFQQAEEIFKRDPNMANRYVEMARKISMKVKIGIPEELKRKFCQHCYKYLVPGINSRTRTGRGKVIISCQECKRFMRVPLI